MEFCPFSFLPFGRAVILEEFYSKKIAFAHFVHKGFICDLSLTQSTFHCCAPKQGLELEGILIVFSKILCLLALVGRVLEIN